MEVLLEFFFEEGAELIGESRLGKGALVLLDQDANGGFGQQLDGRFIACPLLSGHFLGIVGKLGRDGFEFFGGDDPQYPVDLFFVEAIGEALDDRRIFFCQADQGLA